MIGHKRLDILHRRRSRVRIAQPCADPVHRVTKPVQLLSNVKRHEKNVRIVLIPTGPEQSSDHEFAGQDERPELLQRSLRIAGRLRFVERLKDWGEVLGGVRGDFVPHPHAELARQLHAHHRGFAGELKISVQHHLL